MQKEHYRIWVSYSGLRKPVKRICQSAESAKQMVQAYRRRTPNSKIITQRWTLVVEMVSGEYLCATPFFQLPDDAVFSWHAHTVKAIVASKESFKATVQEVKEKVEAAKSDPTFIGVALWIIEDCTL